MNSIVADTLKKCSPRWSRRRWITTFATLFLLQLGVVFLVQHYTATETFPRTRANYRLDTGTLTSRQLARSFFTIDPTLYSSASLHSFSGPAWLRFEFPYYDFPSAPKPANWLEISTNQLGQAPVGTSELPTPLQSLLNASPKVESFLSYLVQDIVRTQSVVTLRGKLTQRAMDIPDTMPARVASEVISNSVVELAADARGEVITTRLIGRSGSAEADHDALKMARALVFTPITSEVGGSPITWGTLTFQWQVLLPPDTNSSVRN